MTFLHFSLLLTGKERPIQEMLERDGVKLVWREKESNQMSQSPHVLLMMGPGEKKTSVCFPVICKMVAMVIKACMSMPLWVTAPSKASKCCTEEALHYREQFIKNPVNLLKGFLPSGQQLGLFLA